MIKEVFRPMTKEQFLTLNPPETRGIFMSTPDGKMEKIAVLGDEVICDICNRDVYTEETPIGYGLCLDGEENPSYMYCKHCYDRHNEIDDDLDEDEL